MQSTPPAQLSLNLTTVPCENRYELRHLLLRVSLTAVFGTVSRSHSPIRQVSVEVLCLIFFFARSKPLPHLGSIDIHRQNLSIVRLTAVCSHWRSVAIEHGILWSNIAFTVSALPTIDCATTFLQRSKGTSLSVHIWDAIRTRRFPPRNSSHGALQNLLSLISSHRHRIAFLEVIEPSPGLFDAFQGPAENVSKMIIQGHPPMERSDPFSGKFPNIQHITLICPGPCRLRFLVNLTQVTLHNGSRRWDIDEFLDFVDGCSSLRSLSVIRYLCFYPGRDSTRTVPLPSLVDLRLNTCDTASILGHLTLPVTTVVSVCVNVKYVSKDFNSIFSCIPSKADHVRFLQNARSLTIVLDRVHRDFRISGFSGATLSFLLQLCGPVTRLDGDWVHRSLEAATNTLRFSEIDSLTLVTDSQNLPWEPWLCQFGRLSTLDVCCADIRGLVVALNYTRSGVPLCHTLRHLTIDVPQGGSWSHHASPLKSAIRLCKMQGGAISCLTINAHEWDGIRRLDPTWIELVRREGL
jgi:hypothetical protein